MTRSVVKHSYIKAANKGRGRAKAHVNYIRFRPGKDENEVNRSFFTDRSDGFTAGDVHRAIDRQNNYGVLVHKLIMSPGVPDADVQVFVRESMSELGRSKGLDLEWFAVEHQNTANPHAHVVVMATDKKGRQVRLHKSDYMKVKEAGDAYLERNRLLDKLDSKESKPKISDESRAEKPRTLKEKLLGVMKAAKEEFQRTSVREPEREKVNRLELLKERENEALGPLPSTEELAAKRAKQEEKGKKSLESAWKYYSTAIELEYGSEKVQYNWHSSIFELRKLQKECLKEGSHANLQLSHDEIRRLETWINDSAYLEKRLFAQAMGVKDISVELSADNKLRLSRGSNLAELNELRRLDRKGDVVLTSVEAKALEIWIREQEKAEPITIKLPGKSDNVLYERTDSREMLEFLASEYKSGEKWTQGMKKKEYSKLLGWIKDKQKDEELRLPKASQEEEKDRF